MDSKITALYLKMLLEDDQQQLFRTMSGGKNKGDEVAISAKDQETGKFDVEDKPDLKLDEQDMADFAALDYADQVRVKKYIQGKASREGVRATFKGQDGEIEQAYRILMSSDMSGDEVESVIQNVNANKAVDSQKLSTVGNYAPLDIFGSEADWEAYQQLMPVGVGKLQQGPGEVAFAMLSKDVDEQTKGDISINGELYEKFLARSMVRKWLNPLEITKLILNQYLKHLKITALNTTSQPRLVVKVHGIS